MSLLAYKRAIDAIGAGSIGGGSLPPGPSTKTVIYRSATSPLGQTPSITTFPPVPGPGGQYRNAASNANVLTALAAAVPGDVIRITNSLPNKVEVRGNKYSIPGVNLTTSPGGGADGNPIIIYCADETVKINPGNQIDPQPALDIKNCDHVHAVGVNTTNSWMSIRYMNCEGSVANPIRVAYCNGEAAGNANFAAQGWFKLISDSGGTPPAGAGNELGYSKNFLVELNNFTTPGNQATNWGECIYLGKGDGPTGYNGWYGYAENVIVRYNTTSLFTANGIEAKPGCRKIYIHGNDVFAGAAHFGAPMDLLYVASLIDDKPGWMVADPEVYAEQNRIWDLNLSLSQTPTANWPVKIGQAGVRFTNNLVWAYPTATGTGSSAHAAVRIQIEKPVAQFGDASVIDTWVRNNTFWGRGVHNYGQSGTPISDITETGNIVPVGYSGGQHTAAVNGSDFEGTIPAVGANDTAQWGSLPAGSGFDLTDASALQGAGTVFTSSELYLDEDISQRTIPGVTPNPGAYQAFT